MKQHLSQEIKDYVLRLHWAGYQFSAIAFKVNKAYNLSITREMVDWIISESLSNRVSAKAWDSSVSS